MPRSRPEGRSHAARALLLAAGALALCAPAAANAQETGLRGGIFEDVALAPSAPIGDAALRTGTRTSPLATNGTAPGVADDEPFSVDPVPTKLPAPRRASRADVLNEEALSAPARKPEGATAVGKDAGAAPAEAEPEEVRAQTTNPRLRTLDAALPLDQGSERTGAIGGLPPRRDDDPFAAVGIRAGSFVLRPTLEQGLTATSNADSSYGGGSAVLSETTLRLDALSDWRRHSAIAGGYLTYRKTVSGEEVEDLRGRVEGTLKLDIEDGLGATARLGYEAAPESASSPVVIEDTVSQPLRQTFDGSLGVEKALGKARLGLTGAVEHETYGDAKLASGKTLSQKDRDSTLYTATLRGGYAVSPALTPFLEIEAGRRLYSQRVDDSGYERSGTRLGARAGIELDMGEKLAGEFSAGWLREAIDDDRLAPISGATVAADLKWSPQRGTTVGLTGATTVEGTTTPGESGSVLYSGRLSLERQIRADLTANAALDAEWRDYVGSNGHDLTLAAEAGLTWWLSRYAGLTARARTEKLTSNLPGREETTHSVFVGLKLQR